MSNKIIYSKQQEDFDYIAVNIPCQHACPVNTNIPAYIRALFESHHSSSYAINAMANIFPGVLGRICSRPCEDMCRHGEKELGNPVNICHIKRAAADLNKTPAEPLKPLPPCGKKVAVIGAGPAGLAAAHDLALAGIDVTVFESFDKPGGMLRYGIPRFRLPRTILEKEINRILKLGIILKTGVHIGDTLSLTSLLENHDCVLVAAGCYTANQLNTDGEDLKGVFSGLDFMIDVCSGRKPAVGKRVLVAGAGFTAFDCARSALRLGAEEVTICLRRTEEDLTVTADEIFQTKLEGVKFNALMLSRRILGTQKVEAVEFVRTRSGVLRPDGKREISEIKGSEFVLPADSLIVATGQTPLELTTGDGKLAVTDTASFTTSMSGVYATGDYLSGPSTVIEAISMGRKAAEVIARRLTGKKYRKKVVRMQETQVTDRLRAWDFVPRQAMPAIQGTTARLKSWAVEVETGFTAQQAAEESKRCYLCYLHYEIDIDRCIYCRYCIDVAPRDCIKLVDRIETNEHGAVTGLHETSVWKDVNAVVIDNARCIRCGECLRVCPVDCISVTRVELMEQGPPSDSSIAEHKNA